MMRGRYQVKALASEAQRIILGLCLTIWGAACIPAGDVPGQVTVDIKETPVGKITLGSGWNTWDHWWPWQMGRYRLGWNDQQWDSYFRLLKESGADWIRVDLYYGNTEPRNDNNDPEVINWAAFTFDNPRLEPFYRHLDFCEANGITVWLVPTRLDNNEYNFDPLTGWLIKYFVEKGYPVPYWKNPPTEMTDRREWAENLAATTYHLIKNREYTCIKQVALYVEPHNIPSLDGYGDTLFLGKLLTKLGIRDRVKILAPYVDSHHLVTKPGDASFPPPSDFDVYAFEDYDAVVNFKTPKEGLKNLSPTYKTDVSELQKKNPLWEAALLEYGHYWCWGAKDPLCSYLKTLSSSCLVFELYNSGYGGMQRWAFEPIYHPYDGWGTYKVEGVMYPPAVVQSSYGSDVDWDLVVEIREAMKHGAKFLKVPQTFEPQRLVNGNLRRGSMVYQVEVIDPAPPGKGVYAIAAKDKEGKWHVGLINLYASTLDVKVVFPVNALSGQLRWDYYDATLPQNSLEGIPPQLVNNTLSLTLTARSLNFLREIGGAEAPEIMTND